MKLLEVVEAATGARSGPLKFESLKDFYLSVKESAAQDSEFYERVKDDYVLVLGETVGDSPEVQFSLLPLLRISSLMALFDGGADEPSRPFNLGAI